MPAHADELADRREHLERYRAVTLQVLDVVESDDDLRWRPGPAHYSLGQQLLHIAQSDDLYSHGLFEGDWNLGRARFPERLPDRSELRAFYRMKVSNQGDRVDDFAISWLGRFAMT
jgi:uncharacterized damage-inducible protein DinB